MSVEAFSLQNDESMDISGQAQLIAYITFVGCNRIVSNFVFRKELPEKLCQCMYGWGEVSDRQCQRFCSGYWVSSLSSSS